MNLCLRIGTAVLCSMFLAASAAGQDPGSRPTTTNNPGIEQGELELMLTPLTRDELLVEVNGWLSLLRAKVVQVVTVESKLRKEADGDKKAPITEVARQLEAQRIELAERLGSVINMYQRKLGDTEKIEEWRSYISNAKLGLVSGGLEAAMNNVKSWAASEAGGQRWALNILKALAAILAFKVLGSILSRVTRRALSRFDRTSILLRDFLVKSVDRSVLFIGLILGMSMLEVPVGPFLAAIGAAGFMIGLALQGTLSNFASGIMILLYRPYDIGEVISVSDVTGTVETMTLVSTTIVTGDNRAITIPNNSIWSDVITNITGKETRRVDLEFGIGYDDSIDEAMRVIEEVVTAHPLVLDNPAPVIKCSKLSDSSVNFVVRPWTRTSDYWSVYWDVTKAIKLRFDQEGISIPFPQRDVHIHQPAPS